MAEADTKERPTTDKVWEALGTVQDPELHMSITELGLVYDVVVDDEGMVTVDMTLTSPACPVGPLLQGMIYHKVTDIEGVEDVEVNLVWSPPWDPREMASEEVKMALGIW
jgi:metal-sulfur cluster biosynthetic enzyme